jgi:site-specific DNA recombinase
MTARKAILYYRVSTDEQADGYSLRHQEERLRNYCEMQNINVVAAFQEDYSAKTFERPEFQKFLDFVKKNKGVADLLLFTKWDRFSRNAGDAYGMINQLKKLRIEPQAIEQPLDLNIPENKMMLAFYLAAPEVENDRRALNTLVGMRRARKEGRWLGPAPRGYLNGKDDQKKPLLVIDPENAPHVKWVFEELARGIHNIEAVRRMAKEKGLDLQRGQFWNMVHNATYCGKVFVAAYKEEDACYVKGIHDAVISEGLFDEVQDVLIGRKRKTKVRSSKDENLPLRGFLVCRNCGRPITGSASQGNGGKYYYYHCQNAKECKERFRSGDAHDVLINELHKISTNGTSLDLYKEVMSELYKKNGTDKTKQVKELNEEIVKLKQRIQNAQILMLDAEISSTEYKSIKNQVLPQIDTLERKKVGVLSSNDDYQKYIDKGFYLLRNIEGYYAKSDLTCRQIIVGSIFLDKFVFEKNYYRTITENYALKLISTPSTDLEETKSGKEGVISYLSTVVPGTGFEPAHPCERCDLNTVRLPISPPGQLWIVFQGLQM